MNGIARPSIVSQVPKLLGFSVCRVRLPGRDRSGSSGACSTGRWCPPRLIGAGSLAVILASAVSRPALPASSSRSSLATARRDGLRASRPDPVVGAVPRGLADRRDPGGQRRRPPALVPGALGIALIAFTDTSVISRTFAARRGRAVDPDQELAALGVVERGVGADRRVPDQQQRDPHPGRGGGRRPGRR